jgi:hypothetical protein
LARTLLVLETVDITHVAGVKLGEASWPAGTPVVPMGDVRMPERIEAWARFPGSGDQPVLRMRLEVLHGVPCFTRIEVEAKHGGRAITGAELDLVRDNLEFWRRTLVELTAQRSEREFTRLPDWADAEVARESLRRVGHRRRATDDRHTRVAELYRAHVSSKPLAAIADVYNVSHRTAARYVQDARNAGHLPPTTPGKKKA